MNIAMLTNIFTPQIGGITRSIQAFTEQYQKRGHQVLIVAPDAEETQEGEDHVVRYPAIPKAYLNKYSLPLPAPGYVSSTLMEFQPDIVHSHHPFLLGVTARRNAALFNVPLVYTHHTRYDSYLESHMEHVSKTVKELFLNMWTGYCNLCDAVVCPSSSIVSLLQKNGVSTPCSLIPTGVSVDQYASGDGEKIRREANIPADAFVVGHLGRLSTEKNCLFLAKALGQFLAKNPKSHFLVVGDGPQKAEMKVCLAQSQVLDRCHFVGVKEGAEVANAYHAMDLFTFTSQSETQGMVLTEAMAAGVPVVALSASGVDDALRDGENGFLVRKENQDQFAAAMEKYYALPAEKRNEMSQAARDTADAFSLESCADRMLDLYQNTIAKNTEEGIIMATQRFIGNEFKALLTALESMGHALLEPEV